MYQGASNALKQALKESIIQYKLRGTINGEFFDEDDVLKGSLVASLQCSGNDEINIGTVNVGQLNVTILKDIDRYRVQNKKLIYEVGVKVGNNYEYVPMGEYNITEATRSAVGLVIKAYDNLSLLDKPFLEQVEGTPFEIAEFLCESCGVTLANGNFNGFANADEQLSQYPDSDIETFRDLAYWIAQTICAFVVANRYGQIEFRKYGMTVVDNIPTVNRFLNGNYADYETWYTGISVVNMAEQTTSYYGMPQDDGLTYNLGSNPFLQYGEYETLRQNILTALSGFKYVPFSVPLAANPLYDLGDVLSFPEGLGDGNKKFCITQMTFKYASELKISSGGKNPKFSSVRNKVDKELTALAKSKSEQDVIQYYSFTNTSEISIGDGNTEVIINIRYTALKKTVAIFLAEVLCDVDTTVMGKTYYDAQGRFYYYWNNIYIDREPVETWVDGKHIKHILYYINIEAGVLNQFQVRLKMTGGSAIIPMGGIKACIYGQNLVASDKWNGVFEITDKASAFTIGTMPFVDAEDSVYVPAILPMVLNHVESINPVTLGQMAFSSASDDLLIDEIIPNRVTEDGIQRVTEDGIIRKTEG